MDRIMAEFNLYAGASDHVRATVRVTEIVDADTFDHYWLVSETNADGSPSATADRREGDPDEAITNAMLRAGWFSSTNHAVRSRMYGRS